MRPLLAALLGLAVFATDATAATFDRTCETRAEGGKPTDVAVPNPRTDVIAGRATIIFARKRASGLPERRHPEQPAAWILKTPVIIRAGAPVVVRVAKRDRAYAALDFDQSRWSKRDRAAEDGQSSVRFHACPPDTKRFVDGQPLGEWTGYPGGLIIERRRCVTLEFVEEGQPTIRQRVGFGRRC